MGVPELQNAIVGEPATGQTYSARGHKGDTSNILLHLKQPFTFNRCSFGHAFSAMMASSFTAASPCGLARQSALRRAVLCPSPVPYRKFELHHGRVGVRKVEDLGGGHVPVRQVQGSKWDGLRGVSPEECPGLAEGDARLKKLAHWSTSRAGAHKPQCAVLQVSAGTLLANFTAVTPVRQPPRVTPLVLGFLGAA